MRIAYIAAGAGGMYCGSCIHDNALAAALQTLGHEVALLPTYTPLKTDETNVSDRHQFYGALNVFLQQKSGLFRHTPRFVDRVLDGRRLLRWISRLGGSTDPTGLGDLTLEMLRGEHGAQHKELDKLVDWLASSYRPDVVVITNSLLLGLVHRIREALGVPVAVCVQGEDLFIDQLPPRDRERVEAEMRKRAADADLFISPSRYYADHMARRLAQDPSRVAVVPLGIDLTGYAGDAAPADGDPAREPVTLGYLARICPEKGLHRLVEAFIALAAEAPGAKALRLRIAGYLGPRDRHYWQEQQARIEAAGLSERVDFLGEIDRPTKLEFLRSLDLLSVPTVYAEPKGLFALEAMASGVPVVLPDHGSFPEILGETDGGLLFEADSIDSLTATLRRLIDDPGQRRRLGRGGRAAVHSLRGAPLMAERTHTVLSALTAAHQEGAS